MTTRVSSSVLANTTVVPGTYGGSTVVPVFVVDQQGRLTSSSNVAISFPSLPQDLATTSNTQFGSLGVGTAPSGVLGEIRAGDEVTAYYTSDERLKENIVTIDNALVKIKQLRGIMFDWKDEYINQRGGEDDFFVRKHDTGVIAQEVEKVLPEIVAERENGYKAVKYEKLAGLLIQAINELADEVESIKGKLN